MPGRRAASKPLDDTLCRRCQQVEPSIVVRTEPICKDCFSKYVQSKVVKRMESFRVRHSAPGKERKLLLPFAHDACSVALIQILSQHLKGQAEKTGRTGFKLCILSVDSERGAESALWADVKSRYSEHEYQTEILSRVLASEDLASLFPEAADEEGGPAHRLQSIMSSVKSATARQDLEQSFTRRLIVQFAKDQECEAVVWQDSTTRLAERTLAETAKGRGFTLPWIVTDGESPLGVPFHYPLRELLSKEIEAYVSYLNPPFEPDMIKAEAKPAVSTKNTTIDDLMGQYFESVEREYPSIVANVVRTAGKLKAPALSEVEQQCELCNMPLEGRAPDKSRLCYGCIRTIPKFS